jgi:hypothetical protein
LVRYPAAPASRDFEPSLPEVFHQPETVHTRHFDVEQRGVRRICVESFQSLKGVAGLLELVAGAGQDAFERFPNSRIVIDNENSAFHDDYGTSVGVRG